jgi:PII-like signaling protein
MTLSGAAERLAVEFDQPPLRAERLTVHLGHTDRHGRTPLYSEIVARARRFGMAGATVVDGTVGFGAASRVHVEHVLRLSEDLPVAIVLVDLPDRIEGFLPTVRELLGDGLVVRDRVEIVAWRGGRRR